jgi:aminoglycoside phosphotransferase (APT) family kinase protein
MEDKQQYQAINLADLIDLDVLQHWLDEQVPTLGSGPLGAKLLHGGTSNAIIEIVRDAGLPMILRRPPQAPPPGSDRAMMREARMLRALAGTNVPHPYLHAACDDASVIGASFYIMAKVEGWSATLCKDDCLYPASFDDAAGRHELGFALADGLIELSGVDYQAVGLGDFGNPAEFLERQASRWRSQIDSYEEKYPGYMLRSIAGLDYVTDWLKSNIPPMSPPGIIHGDYGSPNMIFAHDRPARIEAIVDWELSTIGDPLLDLGWLAYNLQDRRERGVVPASAYYNSTGFPTRQDIAEYYEEKTGRDVRYLDYYMVLAQFKLACICEYKVAEAVIGRRGQDVLDMYGPMVTNLIAEAEKIARRSRMS